MSMISALNTEALARFANIAKLKAQIPRHTAEKPGCAAEMALEAPSMQVPQHGQSSEGLRSRFKPGANCTPPLCVLTAVQDSLHCACSVCRHCSSTKQQSDPQ